MQQHSASDSGGYNRPLAVCLPKRSKIPTNVYPDLLTRPPPPQSYSPHAVDQSVHGAADLTWWKARGIKTELNLRS